jgi:Holliday junction resolvase RusA-like endonuclease
MTTDRGGIGIPSSIFIINILQFLLLDNKKYSGGNSMSYIGREISFSVDGQPKGKMRPRFNGKTGHTYTPKETVNYENYVKISYRMEHQNEKLEGPIEAEITGVFPIPKSTSKKKSQAMLDGGIKYTKKIDCDNLAKSVLDALNGIAYDDDAQVYSLKVCKIYGEQPRVDITLRESINVEHEIIKPLYFFEGVNKNV